VLLAGERIEALVFVPAIGSLRVSQRRDPGVHLHWNYVTKKKYIFLVNPALKAKKWPTHCSVYALRRIARELVVTAVAVNYFESGGEKQCPKKSITLDAAFWALLL
jgi:hypothetical protein